MCSVVLIMATVLQCAAMQFSPMLLQLCQDIINGPPDHVADAPHLERTALARLADTDHGVRVAGVPLEVHHLQTWES